MNRMLVLSFVEVFEDETFQAEVKLDDTTRLFIMEWVRNSNIPSAKRIVQRLTAKADKRRSPKAGSSSATDKVLNELNERQVQQTYRAALSVHAFGCVDQRIKQVFDITFREKLRSITFINAGSYVQAIMDRRESKQYHRKLTPLRTNLPTVFEVLLWMHSVNIIGDLLKVKKATFKLNYNTGNIIGYIVSKVTAAWKKLFAKIRVQSLSQSIAPYIWFDTSSGTFRHLPTGEGFAPSSQLQTFLPQVLPAPSGTGVSQVASSRTADEDKAYRHLAYALLKKLKDITSNNIVHSTPLEDIPKIPDIKALIDCGADGLPYVFAELDDHLFNTFRLNKPVPYPLQFYNLEDASPERVGQKTLISSKPIDRALCYKLAFPTLSGPTGRRRLPSSSTNSAGRPRKRQRTLMESFKQLSTTPSSSTDTIPPVPKDEDILLPNSEHEQEVVNEEMAVNSPSYQILSKELARYVTTLACPFDKIVHEHEFEVGASIKENVDLILTDPPYNIRNEKEKPNSDYDTFPDEDFLNFTEFADETLAPGGQAVIFCSFMQFSTWVNNFRSIIETVQEQDDKDASKIVTENKRVFTVEDIPLKFMRTKGYYNTTPAGRRLNHMSMGEIAMHAWKKNGVSYTDILNRVNYTAPPYVPSSFPGWTDTIDNIPRLPKNEVVYQTGPSTTGSRRPMVRPEQKNVSLMKTLLAKYCPAGGMVCDPFSGTFAVAKACISLPEHRKCVSADKDEDCFNQCKPSLVEVFAEQVLNEESDIIGTDEVRNAAATFLRLIRASRTNHVAENWEAPSGLSPMQYLPEHILHFLSSLYSDYSLLRTYKKQAYVKWSASWRNRFNQTDIHQLLSVELAFLQLEMRKSTVPNAGNGIFTTKSIGKGQLIGYFYGALIYDNLGIGAKRNSNQAIGEGIMAIPVNEFSKWSAELTSRAYIGGRKDKASETKVWIYPVPFCAMRYLNDGRRSGPNDDENGVPPPDPEACNVQWVEVEKTPTNVGFQEPSVVSVIAKRNIAANSELFIDYGHNFTRFS